MIHPAPSALILAALLVIAVSMALQARRRTRRAQRELARRQHQRATVQQLVADFQEDCAVHAHQHRMAVRPDWRPLALVLSFALGALTVEVRVW